MYYKTENCLIVGFSPLIDNDRGVILICHLRCVGILYNMELTMTDRIVV